MRLQSIVAIGIDRGDLESIVASESISGDWNRAIGFDVYAREAGASIKPRVSEALRAQP